VYACVSGEIGGRGCVWLSAWVCVFTDWFVC